MVTIEAGGTLRVFESATENSRSSYIVITGETAAAIRRAAMTGQWQSGGRRFGSAKVTVTLGSSIWQTIVIPDKESGGWVLPIRVGVCRAEGLRAGDEVRATVTL